MKGKFKTKTDSIYNGFTLSFENGNTISVQFSQFNYSDGETTAEVAAWDTDGEWINLSDNPGDDVVGWQTTDKVADLIQKVKSL